MSPLFAALGQLATGAVFVALAATPSLVRCHRLRRLVPGMSWCCAWRLTAPQETNR